MPFFGCALMRVHKGDADPLMPFLIRRQYSLRTSAAEVFDLKRDDEMDIQLDGSMGVGVSLLICTSNRAS
jgi:hypothetical protein